MVIDTSALIEIFIDGSQARAVKTALRGTRGNRFMSSATYLEAHIVVRRRFAGVERSRKLLDRLIARYAILLSRYKRHMRASQLTPTTSTAREAALACWNLAIALHTHWLKLAMTSCYSSATTFRAQT